MKPPHIEPLPDDVMVTERTKPRRPINEVRLAECECSRCSEGSPLVDTKRELADAMSGRDVELWRDAFDEVARLTVIPFRSVQRVRNAISEGRDAEPYLHDMEICLRSIAKLVQEMEAHRG